MVARLHTFTEAKIDCFGQNKLDLDAFGPCRSTRSCVLGLPHAMISCRACVTKIGRSYSLGSV